VDVKSVQLRNRGERIAMQKQLGLALMLIGVVMFVYGTSVSLGYVLVTIDDTPPYWRLLHPSTATGGALTELVAYVKDDESGIENVTCTVGGYTWDLAHVGDDPDFHDEHWYRYIPEITEPGDYPYTWTITNKVGLTTTVTGTYTIYTELQGKWYINGIEITSPTQELILPTKTLEFKFEVTTGTVQTCTVEWSGPETGSMTLEETLSHTNWIGTHTFTQSGTYTMTLTASDETSTVTMAVWGVNLGGEAGWSGIELNMWQWTGLALIGVGSIFTLKGKSKQEA